MLKNTYGGVTLAYTISGEPSPNRPDILLLHGWGVDHTSLNMFLEGLSSDARVIAIDFPGFGESPEPSEPWDNRRYSELIETFIQDEKLRSPVLICHSFGGRVALDLASRKPDLVGKLVLMGSAGVRPKHKTSYYAKLYSFKAVRVLARIPGFHWLLSDFLTQYRQKYGSADYQKASEIMRRTLSKVVDENLTPVMKHIKAPTLLIWGDKDTATPIEHAKIMEENIPGAGLVVYEGQGHYAFLNKAPETLRIIHKFIEKELVRE
jgi:pimeloyl-ACP methyl ester carboxylesterase